MTSVQNFEVVQRSFGGVKEETLKDVVTIVKQVVANYSLDMAMSIIKNKLNKKYGGKVIIQSSQFGRRMFYWIGGMKVKGFDAVLVEGKWCQVEKGVDVKNLSTVEKRSLPAYRWGIVSGYVKVVESFSLLNLALRKVMEMLKDKESVQTLEIPDEVKDIMNKYWSF